MKVRSDEKLRIFFAFEHLVVYIITGYPEARMVKLADTQDLGSCIARCVGSSPTSRTICFWKNNLNILSR